MMDPNTELVNPEAAVEDLGLGMDDYKEFLGDLKVFLDQAIPDLRKAIEARDMVNIREHSHAMKGALRNLRFIKAGDVSSILENIGAGRENGDAMTVFQELESVLAASWAHLRSKGF